MKLRSREISSQVDNLDVRKKSSSSRLDAPSRSSNEILNKRRKSSKSQCNYESISKNETSTCEEIIHDMPIKSDPTTELATNVENPIPTIKIKQESFDQEFPINPLQVLSKYVKIEKCEGYIPTTASNIFIKVQKNDLTENQPVNWDIIYNKVVDMRSKFIAPVDTMGCERIPEQVDPTIRNSPTLFRFQLLISLMLSSQTKDEVNYQAVSKLNHYFKENGFPQGLCIDAVIATEEDIIDKLIFSVGFHKRKASYMKKSCILLKEKFNSDIPKTITEIVSLPGVGPKMGYLLLHKAWNISEGIGVDVHLHRLAQMWKWAPNSNNPETTRKFLQKWLPKKFWAEINPLLVGFGQMVCTPQSSNCDICSLSSGLCGSVKKSIVNQRGSPERLAKLQKTRGDLTQLITDIEDLC